MRTAHCPGIQGLGQIGSTVFDTKNRVATAYVAKTADLTNVAVTALKLGPEEITTYSPSLDELTGTSFESVRFVDISYHGRASGGCSTCCTPTKSWN